ncbi:Hypothetical protein CINCED_3A019933 [Cinara cedri]|uniref:Uncharacterized protein n=1 Tax=Cinara cedri TaxID=506608 RepID=A0A5E4MHG8_9HEMI|nr:Hypothetical protein CINCED_3A019933 [Cinara cedri]
MDNDQFPSPVKQNPSGKLISIGILYKSKKFEVPRMKYKDLMELISKNLGIGVNRVCITVSEYKSNTLLTSPNR